MGAASDDGETRGRARAALAGQVALVTGAARGIGRGIALALAEAGADVAIADLLDDPALLKEAEETAAGVRALGRRALLLACDVTRYADCEAAVAEARARLGGLDVVVANAGVLAKGPVLELDPALWARVLAVNATGTFHICRAALPHLVAQRRGSIVNVASTTGLRASRNRAAYSASKFAVVGFSQALAAEVAELGVRVNVVCPAAVRSGMTLGELMEATGERDPAAADALWTKVSQKRLPLGRSVEPADIGAAVVYLCTAGAVTAAVLSVTGGEGLP